MIPPSEGRSASPSPAKLDLPQLELLYDLTFVVAFGTAADQLAHYLAEGHIGPAIGGFCFAVFAVTWAWMNYSWFASAYDNDDWVFRIATMVQMVGVIIWWLVGRHDPAVPRRRASTSGRSVAHSLAG